MYLPPGTYTVTGQINLPANTVLKGAGADKTWLTLAKQNMSEAPQDGYFTSNMTGGWGVEDLTVYTSSAGYYYSIFNMQKIHDGVTVRRVVLRAQPFHSQVKFCYSGRAHPPGTRYHNRLVAASCSSVIIKSQSMFHQRFAISRGLEAARQPCALTE